MAWLASSVLLENYISDDQRCDNCNSSNINVISGSEITCLTCGYVTSSIADFTGLDSSNDVFINSKLNLSLIDKGKLSFEWKKICNKLNISDDKFFRNMLYKRKRNNRKIASNRFYFRLLVGSLYYIEKSNSGAPIFLDDVIDRLGISSIPRKFAKVVSLLSRQLNLKINSQNLYSLIRNMISQLSSNKSVEYITISKDDIVDKNSILSQVIQNKTLIYENHIVLNSSTLFDFISNESNRIVDAAVAIMDRFSILDTNLKFVDDVLSSEWRKYGYSSKITIAIAIHIALYKLSFPLAVKEYVSLLSINRSSFYRRRGYIQKLVGECDPVIPLKYFQIPAPPSDILAFQEIPLEDCSKKQRANFITKYRQLKGEVGRGNMISNVSIIRDNISGCFMCKFIINGKSRKRCFSFNRYGLDGALKLANEFKNIHG